MKINIKATGMHLTPSIQEYAEKRVESLEKFLGEDSSSALAEIEVGLVTRHHKTGDVFRAELNLTHKGDSYYADASKEDLYAAIDEMRDKIERECVSRKNKKKTLEREGDAAIKNILREGE